MQRPGENVFGVYLDTKKTSLIWRYLLISLTPVRDWFFILPIPKVLQEKLKAEYREPEQFPHDIIPEALIVPLIHCPFYKNIDFVIRAALTLLIALPIHLIGPHLIIICSLTMEKPLSWESTSPWWWCHICSWGFF